MPTDVRAPDSCSAIGRDAAAAPLPWCSEHHSGVIAYSQMQKGLSTGTCMRGVRAPGFDAWIDAATGDLGANDLHETAAAVPRAAAGSAAPSDPLP